MKLVFKIIKAVLQLQANANIDTFCFFGEKMTLLVGSMSYRVSLVLLPNLASVTLFLTVHQIKSNLPFSNKIDVNVAN